MTLKTLYNDWKFKRENKEFYKSLEKVNRKNEAGEYEGMIDDGRKIE